MYLHRYPDACSSSQLNLDVLVTSRLSDTFRSDLVYKGPSTAGTLIVVVCML